MSHAYRVDWILGVPVELIATWASFLTPTEKVRYQLVHRSLAPIVRHHKLVTASLLEQNVIFGYLPAPGYLGPEYKYTMNEELDCLDSTGQWHIAVVIELTPSLVSVRYKCWSELWNEWIPRDSMRFAVLYTHTAIIAGGDWATLSRSSAIPLLQYSARVTREATTETRHPPTMATTATTANPAVVSNEPSVRKVIGYAQAPVGYSHNPRICFASFKVIRDRYFCLLFYEAQLDGKIYLGVWTAKAWRFLLTVFDVLNGTTVFYEPGPWFGTDQYMYQIATQYTKPLLSSGVTTTTEDDDNARVLFIITFHRNRKEMVVQCATAPPPPPATATIVAALGSIRMVEDLPPPSYATTEASSLPVSVHGTFYLITAKDITQFARGGSGVVSKALRDLVSSSPPAAWEVPLLPLPCLLWVCDLPAANPGSGPRIFLIVRRGSSQHLQYSVYDINKSQIVTTTQTREAEEADIRPHTSWHTWDSELWYSDSLNAVVQFMNERNIFRIFYLE